MRHIREREQKLTQCYKVVPISHHLNHIFNLLLLSLTLLVWSRLLILLLEKDFSTVLTDFVLLVILANALDGSICLVLFDSVDITFLSSREDDSKRLFSLPLLCICFFLLNSRRESVPFNNSDPTFIVLLLEFKLLRLGGSMQGRVSILNACVVMGVPCNLSSEYTNSVVVSSCCFLNFWSSSLTCNYTDRDYFLTAAS